MKGKTKRGRETDNRKQNPNKIDETGRKRDEEKEEQREGRKK